MNLNNNESFNENLERQIVSFITTHYGSEVFTPGLERTAPLFADFVSDARLKKIKIVTVAGTNGKGQCAYTLGTLFKSNHISHAIWSSPHILSIRERFIISASGFSSTINYADLWSEINICHSELENSSLGLKISFYEFLFLVFLKWALKTKNLSYIILEVGLGGRLDAVNHFDADLVILTSISRDHQAILGNSYRQILYEKLGVVRPNSILISALLLEYLNSSVKDFVREYAVNWKKYDSEVRHLDYFKRNQCLAVEAYNILEKTRLNTTSIDQIFKHNSYKGRREIMTFLGKSLIFIGAHNTDGFRNMLEMLKSEGTHFDVEAVLFSFSMRPIEEVVSMIKSLIKIGPQNAKLTLTAFEHAKALDKIVVEDVAKRFDKGMLNFASDWKKYLNEDSSNTLLICGSYYFIGEVQRYILSHHK